MDGSVVLFVDGGLMTKGLSEVLRVLQEEIQSM